MRGKFSSFGIEYKIDKEMLKLITEANKKYGEYKSLLNTVECAYNDICSGATFSMWFVNDLHRIVLNSVRVSEKTPGQIRVTQNWIVKIIKGNSVYRIMPVIMKQIVFTKKDVSLESGVSPNSVPKIFGELEELGIIVRDTIIKKAYRYQKIYEVFVGTNEY